MNDGAPAVANLLIYGLITPCSKAISNKRGIQGSESTTRKLKSLRTYHIVKIHYASTETSV